MGNEERRDVPDLGDESLDGVLRAVFGDEGDGESVLAAVGRVAGEPPRVLLRDGTDEPSPVLKAHARSGPEAVEDDPRYQVLGEIARGGVGVVYKARDRDLGRSVALKVLRADHADNPDVLERFVEEAQIEGQLQHPGVVPVYGLGLQPDGRPCFAMKLVRGETLSARLQAREEPSEDRHATLAVFERVCQAMAYAHARGVVHRDLKPANVMIGAHGEVQVMDWGFAKVLGREPRRPASESVPPSTTIVATVRTGSVGSESIAGSVMGTPAYMPPEQALGRVDELDERSDVFALGAILCEVLTGLPPYAGEPEDLLVMAAHARQEDARARLSRCEADEALVDLTRRCLEPLRADRPRHAGEVADAIHGYLAAAEERVRVAEIRAAEFRAAGAEERARLAAARLAKEKLEARAAEERAEAEREARLVGKEMRRAAAARRARLGILAAAAGLVLAVVLGGTGWLKAGAERATRTREVETRVSEAIRRAGELEGRGDLGSAAEAAKAAVALAADAGEEARERATELAARIERAQEKAESAEEQRRRDVEMRRRLERARLARIEAPFFASTHRGEDDPPKFPHTDDRGTDRALVLAFREYGVDVETLSLEEAAARIQRSAIADDLVATLDEWTWLRKYRLEAEEAAWTRLLEITRRVDPDPLRNELRRVMIVRDRDAMLKLVDRALATTTDARALAILSNGLRDADWKTGFAQRYNEAALGLLEEARRRRPRDILILTYLAEAYATLDRWDETLSCREALVALLPDSSLAWNNLGATRASLGEFERALEAYEHALDLDPHHVLAISNTGVTYGRLGEIDKAIRWQRKALDVDPEHASAHINMGWYHWVRGDTEKAERCYRKAVDVAPDCAQAHWNLAWFLSSIWEVEEALEQYEKTLEVLPEHVGLRVAVAWLHAWNGHAEKALRLLEPLEEWYPDAALPRFHLANVRFAAGRIEEAERELRQLVEDFPDFGQAHLVLSGIHNRKKEWVQALDAARRAVRANPGWESYAGRAGALDQLGRFDEAAKDLAEAVRLNDEIPNTQLNLAHCLRFLGQTEKMEEHLRRAAELDPRSPLLYSRLAGLCWTRGKVDEGLDHCRDGLAVDERWPGLHAHRGLFLFAQGRFRSALDASRRSLVVFESLSRNDGRRDMGEEVLRSTIEDFEAAVPFEDRMDEIADGTLEPLDDEQRLFFAWLCSITGRCRAAVRLYREAFAGDPDALVRDDNYDWAVAAAVETGARESRDQALAWLRALLVSLSRELPDADLERTIEIRRELWAMRVWPRLAPVREKLGDLPEDEQVPWRTLWRDQDALLARALAKEDR